MVRAPGAYPWSSYACNAAGKSDPLITPHAAHHALAPDLAQRHATYRQLFADAIAPATLT